MRVAILPTGRMEWHALPRALARLFPGHTFYCLPTEALIRSHLERFPYDGVTSVALQASHEETPPESARELVARAAQEALGDRKQAPADLVVIVDDVELPNMAQPDRIVRVMHHAAQAHLEQLSAHAHLQDLTRDALKTRVSFHLISPMVEAWLFADPEALERAGVADPTTRVCFAETTDPEQFSTDDPAYLSAVEGDCPRWASRGRKKKDRPKWLGGLDRARHPKGYLQWLCIAPDDKCCTTYSETHHGAEALAHISWARLLGRPAAQMGYLRALIEDIAYCLDTAPTTPTSGTASPLTGRLGDPAFVLRNL